MQLLYPLDTIGLIDEVTALRAIDRWLLEDMLWMEILGLALNWVDPGEEWHNSCKVSFIL
jgi:hypothetical protein